MYYEIGETNRKIINIDGFKFMLSVTRSVGYVSIEISDIKNKLIDSIEVYDESGLSTALDILNNSVYNWIEQNTDEQDRLMNLVMKW